MLCAVARGRTNSEIADELYITLSTVKTHIASLMAKLGARNRVEIAMWAYETDRRQALTRPAAAQSAARERGRPIIAASPSSRIGRCSSEGCSTRIATTSSIPAPAGLQSQVLVLLVAPDQGIGRVALQPLGQRAQLVRRQPLGHRAGTCGR